MTQNTNKGRQDGALPSALKDTSCEDIDDALNEVDELLQRWDNRFTVKNPAFAKRYKEDEFVIVLVFVCDTGRWGSHPKQFRAMFQRHRRRECGLVGEFGGPRNLHSNRPFDLIVRPSDRHEQLVLIENVQSVQTPEGAIRSVVWLQSLSENDGFFGSSIKAGSDIPFGELDGLTYWELGVIPGCAAVSSNQVAREKVESGAEVMDNIANGAAPSGGNVILHRKLVDFISSLQITITDDEIRFSALESSYLGLQLVKMLFGPVDLYPAAKEQIYEAYL